MAGETHRCFVLRCAQNYRGWLASRFLTSRNSGRFMGAAGNTSDSELGRELFSELGEHRSDLTAKADSAQRTYAAEQERSLSTEQRWLVDGWISMVA
jgi:hypothetical protein